MRKTVKRIPLAGGATGPAAPTKSGSASSEPPVGLPNPAEPPARQCPPSSAAPHRERRQAHPQAEPNRSGSASSGPPVGPPTSAAPHRDRRQARPIRRSHRPGSASSRPPAGPPTLAEPSRPGSAPVKRCPKVKFKLTI